MQVDVLSFVEVDDTVGVGCRFSWSGVLHALGTDGAVVDREKIRSSNCRAGFHAKRGLLWIDIKCHERRGMDVTWQRTMCRTCQQQLLVMEDACQVHLRAICELIVWVF